MDVEFTYLDYVEVVEKPLTANARSQSLRDHYLGFAAHHPGGELPDIGIPDESAMDIVIFCACESVVSKKFLKTLARRMSRLSGVDGVGYMRCREILARAMGYRTEAAALAGNRGKDIIVNIRHRLKLPAVNAKEVTATLKLDAEARYRRRLIMDELKRDCK